MHEPPKEKSSESGIKPAVSLVTKEIIVVTSHDIVTATAQIPQQQRIIDFLNKSMSEAGQKINHDFLTLSDACLYDLRGNKVMTVPQLYRGKNDILFILEAEGKNITDVPSTTSTVKPYPYSLYREKKAFTVQVTLPSFILEGTIYSEKWQQVNHVLEQENMFIAMTSITLMPSIPIGIHSARFAAVNKYQILYVIEQVR